MQWKYDRCKLTRLDMSYEFLSQYWILSHHPNFNIRYTIVVLHRPFWRTDWLGGLNEKFNEEELIAKRSSKIKMTTEMWLGNNTRDIQEVFPIISSIQRVDYSFPVDEKSSSNVILSLIALSRSDLRALVNFGPKC